jgi:flagellar biosynthesis chaperone FliJ
MPSSHRYQHLLHLRGIEEEQSQSDLDSARIELSSLERALEGAHQRRRIGRQTMWSALESGEISDRLAGLVEMGVAERQAEFLSSRIVHAKQSVKTLQSDLLGKRTKRKQAEVLVNESRTQEVRQAERRVQQDLDEWFRSRRESRLRDPDQF